MAIKIKSNYDSPWKSALDGFFQDFMAFFFPIIHDDIDWNLDYQTLDKELLEVTPKAKIGNRYADKLIKVWLKDGDFTWLLIHVEVQSDKDPHFAKRMFIYNHRLFDRYQQPVISLAVLADEHKNWRPKKYGYHRWEFASYLCFPAVKLLDYQSKWEDLENDTNPFAFMVMVSLKSKATKNKPQQRLHWKKVLVKGLHERGYTKETIRLMLLFLDWIMVLPKLEKTAFTEYVKELERERKMEYVTTWERDGIEKGLEKGLKKGLEKGIQKGLVKKARESVMEVLQVRFEKLIPQLQNKFEKLRLSLEGIKDLAILEHLHKQAIIVSSVEEFEQIEQVKQVWSTQEKLAVIKGLYSSVVSILQTKFGEIPQTMEDNLRGIAQEQQLRKLIELAVTVESIKEFELIIEETQEGKS